MIIGTIVVSAIPLVIYGLRKASWKLTGTGNGAGG
jgi:hypothetical protein